MSIGCQCRGTVWNRNDPETGNAASGPSVDRASRTSSASAAIRRMGTRPRGGRGRALYCRVLSKWRRACSSSGRSVVNFHDGTEARITTPFSSVTRAGASTVAQDCSNCSRLTLTTATPTVRPSSVSGDDR